MEDNEILAEIRRIRDEHARAHNFDVSRMFEEMRRETEQLKAERWNVVNLSEEAPSSSVVREEPPAPRDESK